MMAFYQCFPKASLSEGGGPVGAEGSPLPDLLTNAIRKGGMAMRKAKIIIGCSYGDEGKGLATAHAARRMEGPCRNVLINGGAQRGHTVDLPDGRRHVFHHFGSGLLAGARSCADRDFIVNPMLFEQERAELASEFALAPRLLASERCRVTTPWDMMLGQIIEENRGAARHGSCGCGIFETRLRFERTDWSLPLGRMAKLPWHGYRAYCRRIAGEYLPARLKALGMAAGGDWLPLLASEGLVEHSWEDLQAMLRHTDLYRDWPGMAAKWPNLLFEAGQGLALDEFNTADAPHLTPSRTTSRVSAERIAALPGGADVEILYVTRSYLTRHGAGPLPTECPMADIRPDIVDRTNVSNIHQQSLRYGRFDAGAVLERVGRDLAAAREVLPNVRNCAVVTHLNETGGALFGDMALADFVARFDRAMLSDCPWDVQNY